MILLCCYNTAAEAFPKLCHVVREGERKQLLFPLSKMAEGRGKQLWAERQSGVLRPAQGRAGRFSEHLSPRFPLLTNALCPISRLSEQTNGIQLCCQSRRNPTWPTTRGDSYDCKPVRLIWLLLCSHRDSTHGVKVSSSWCFSFSASPKRPTGVPEGIHVYIRAAWCDQNSKCSCFMTYIL